MYKIQSSIYLMCFCICILITSSRAFSQARKDVDEHEKIFERNATQERIIKTYADKTNLRTKIKKILKKMTPDDRNEQSSVIVNELLNHPLYELSKSIAVYINMDTEVQTQNIIKNIFETGKVCYIPKYDKHNNMSMVRLQSMDDFMSLPKTKLNITQPADDDEREDVFQTGDLDLIIVPGLGFTDYGKRLGRGKGCYDRFFAEYDRKFPENACMSIGLAYSQQTFEDIPTSPEDYLVDFVMTYNDRD